MRLWVRGTVVLLCVGMPCAVHAAQPSDPPAESWAAAFPGQLPVPRGSAAELARLNAEILRHPQDTALNLRYAALAEQLGERRLALSAYERILIYDPQNAAALAGVDRIRRGIQPNTTQYLLAFGAAYESNPTYAPSGSAHGEGQFFGDLNVRDDRSVGDMRWRTLANVDGIAHGDENELDYAYSGATTGPVWELLPGVQVNPAIGGGASIFDDHFFYSEAIGRVTFEAYPNGAYQSVTVRGAFRDYDTFFVPDHYGGNIDATGKFTIPLSVPNVAFSISPWVRWAEIEGPLGAVTTATAVQPGDYTEVGGQLNGYLSLRNGFAPASPTGGLPPVLTKAPASPSPEGFVLPDIILGANIAVSERYYRDEVVVGATNQRRDTTVSPGASIIIPHLFQYQNTLRFDYTYIDDRSNDPTKSFVDNIGTVTWIRSF